MRCNKIIAKLYSAQKEKATVLKFIVCIKKTGEWNVLFKVEDERVSLRRTAVGAYKFLGSTHVVVHLFENCGYSAYLITACFFLYIGKVYLSGIKSRFIKSGNGLADLFAQEVGYNRKNGCNNTCKKYPDKKISIKTKLSVCKF